MMNMANNIAKLVSQWQNRENAHSFEGDSGLRKFEGLIGILGYRGTPYKNGSPIEQFLSDNPGAMEALLLWTMEQTSPEWKENLKESLVEGDEDDNQIEEEEGDDE